jgi:hypothetical protein
VTDVFRRRLHQIERQIGFRIGRRIAVELGPARIVMQRHVEHLVVGIGRLEALVAEGARELMRQRRVLVHHDRQAGLARRRRLDDHAVPSPVAFSIRMPLYRSSIEQ